MPGVTVLCGGFGAARFVSGLRLVAGVELTCVVNVADDFVYEGLSVSPDLDSITYALAGRFDEQRGWGLVGDTFGNAEALRRYGSGWFGIGDTDLATHLVRSRMLAAGSTLSETTTVLGTAMGLASRVLPMSDDSVRTMVVTPDSRLPLQEYLVRHRGVPTVLAVEHDGLDRARPAPAVLRTITTADLVIIAPSNPVSSIGPILALPGLADAVAERPAVAVTSVVSGQAPVTGPERSRANVRAAFMGARGLQHRATDVARLYTGLVGRFVLDRRDSAETSSIESLGFEVLLADTLAPAETRPDLAATIAEFGLR
jgi:LPPG:FO 2-phospho-L-lactate transferase